MALQRRAEHLLGLLQPLLLQRPDDRVEHQADSRQRLHRPVVEEECEPPALILLGRDQLVGEPCALRFAHPRLGQEARILDRPRGEIREQRRARLLLAVERSRADELERADLLAPDPQGEDGAVRGRRTGRQNFCLRPEQVLRLAPGSVQHLVGIERRGDRAHRLDQRLEEARLCAQLLFDDLVPPALGDDEVERETGRAHDRHGEAREREPARAEREPDDRDDSGRRNDGDEGRCSSR